MGSNVEMNDSVLAISRPIFHAISSYFLRRSLFLYLSILLFSHSKSSKNNIRGLLNAAKWSITKNIIVRRTMFNVLLSERRGW